MKKATSELKLACVEHQEGIQELITRFNEKSLEISEFQKAMETLSKLPDAIAPHDGGTLLRPCTFLFHCYQNP